VILLVGAFDPLDEQEAQRVGADGVLKKPFVPPDPLISMVKSALTRAGISIGPPPAAEKPPEAARKGTPEWLKPATASKLAALASDKTPEPEEETADVPEEFPTQPQQLKIASGQGPVAFGSLLGTQEEEEIATTAHSPLADDLKWGAHGEAEEEEHEDEDSSHAGWRPGGLEEAAEKVAVPSKSVPDWRDEAFHGSSPATNIPVPPWQTSTTKAPAVASVEAVAVTTIEAKPAPSPTPFSSDAWASAMATGIEAKLAGASEAVQKEPEIKVEAPAAAENHQQATPGNSWFSANATPWEAEARKASQLASAWDAPVADVPAPQAEVAQEEPAPEVPSPAPEDEPEPQTEPPDVLPTEDSHAPEARAAVMQMPPGPVAHKADVNETQEVPVYKEEAPSWHAPAPVQEAPVEEPLAPVAVAQAAVAAPEAKQPDMEELIARVLAKMNPEVIHRVTQEILRPVIEALVKEELNSKKS